MPPATEPPRRSERDAFIIIEDGAEASIILEEPGAIIFEHDDTEELTIEAKKK